MDRPTVIAIDRRRVARAAAFAFGDFA